MLSVRGFCAEGKLPYLSPIRKTCSAISLSSLRRRCSTDVPVTVMSFPGQTSAELPRYDQKG